MKKKELALLFLARFPRRLSDAPCTCVYSARVSGRDRTRDNSRGEWKNSTLKHQQRRGGRPYIPTYTHTYIRIMTVARAVFFKPTFLEYYDLQIYTYLRVSCYVMLCRDGITIT